MRKLATFSVALAAAVFTAHYILPPRYFVWAALMCALFSLGGLLFRADSRLRAVLICLGAAAGFAVSAASYSAVLAPSMELDGKTLSVRAEVKEYVYESERYSSVRVRLRGEGLPAADTLVYFYGSEPPELRPGDIISLTGSFKYAGERYGEAWDGRIADGVYLLCYPEKLEVTGRSGLSFLYFPRDIERDVNTIATEIMPEGARAFITALLTGNKSLLYEDLELYTAMTSAGIMHVVAVSGMHVAFLTGFLRLVVRRKRTASLIGIPMVWIFAAVAGGTASVLRAAFMQSALLAAPLLKRESDSLTSLSAILAVLLVINPAAIASLSLQLSFTATLGLVLLTPGLNRRLSRAVSERRRAKARGEGRERLPARAGYKALQAVIASFSATIGALCFSLPVMAYAFGYMATYTVIVNILVFWAVSACFVLGYISCLLGAIWLPLGLGAGALTGVLAEYVTLVARFFGGLPLSRIYTGEGYFLFWLIFTYALFIGWYILHRKRGARPIIPAALSLAGLFLGVILLQLSAQSAPPRFAAVDVGQGQSVVISSGASALVIDCGGTGTPENAGDSVAEYLLSRGISSIEALCITHFDSDHTNGAMRLMSLVGVKRLIIAPEAEPNERREALLSFAGARGTEIIEAGHGARLSFSGLELQVFAPVSRSEPELIYLAAAGDYDILVTGDASEAIEKRFLLTHELPGIEIFVAGHHGSKNSNSMALLEAARPETVVISSGYNSYGHPSVEALSRFEEFGCELLRTDTLGDIEIVLTR